MRRGPAGEETERRTTAAAVAPRRFNAGGSICGAAAGLAVLGPVCAWKELVGRESLREVEFYAEMHVCPASPGGRNAH